MNNISFENVFLETVCFEENVKIVEANLISKY